MLVMFDGSFNASFRFTSSLSSLVQRFRPKSVTKMQIKCAELVHPPLDLVLHSMLWPIASIVTVGVFFAQIPRTEESISDRTGFIYFTLTFWSFDIMFTALFACESLSL